MTSDIIARRELVGGGRTYEVRIEKPQATDDDTYSCRFSLVDDAGAEVVSQEMYGVDSMQALGFAVAIVGERLACEDTQFTWHGLQGTGLPRVLDAPPEGGPAFFFPVPKD